MAADPRWEKVAEEMLRENGARMVNNHAAYLGGYMGLRDAIASALQAAHSEGQREGRAGHHESCAALRLDAEGGPSRLRCDCRCQANGCFAFMTDNNAEKPCGAGCWRIRRARASNTGSPR